MDLCTYVAVARGGNDVGLAVHRAWELGSQRAH